VENPTTKAVGKSVTAGTLAGAKDRMPVTAEMPEKEKHQ
jgi:hypothetical protein